MDSTTTCEATGLREACSLSLHIWPLPDNARPEYRHIHVLNYCNPLLVATQMRQAPGALLLQLSTQLQQAATAGHERRVGISGKRGRIASLPPRSSRFLVDSTSGEVDNVKLWNNTACSHAS